MAAQLNVSGSSGFDKLSNKTLRERGTVRSKLWKPHQSKSAERFLTYWYVILGEFARPVVSKIRPHSKSHARRCSTSLPCTPLPFLARSATSRMPGTRWYNFAWASEAMVYGCVNPSEYRRAFSVPMCDRYLFQTCTELDWQKKGGSTTGRDCQEEVLTFISVALRAFSIVIGLTVAEEVSFTSRNWWIVCAGMSSTTVCIQFEWVGRCRREARTHLSGNFNVKTINRSHQNLFAAGPRRQRDWCIVGSRNWHCWSQWWAGPYAIEKKPVACKTVNMRYCWDIVRIILEFR